jgi:hypothetical protein
MKKFLNLILSISIVIISSCKTTTSDPSTVAIAFSKALNNSDYTKAKEYCTPESATFIDMIASFSTNVPDSVKNKYTKLKLDVVGKPTIDGNKAVVVIKESNNPDNKTINLVKDDKGAWKVEYTKDNPSSFENKSSDEVPSSEAEIKEANDTSSAAKNEKPVADPNK